MIHFQNRDTAKELPPSLKKRGGVGRKLFSALFVLLTLGTASVVKAEELPQKKIAVINIPRQERF